MTSGDGDSARVRDYFQLAVTSHSDWGASAKVDHLKLKWSSLVQEQFADNGVWSINRGERSILHTVDMSSLPCFAVGVGLGTCERPLLSRFVRTMRRTTG